MTTTANRLVLGTVQFGLDYGIANRTGRPSSAAIARMLEIARRGGITTLDTARGYGDAEKRLSAHLRLGDTRWQIVTKVPQVGSADPRQAVDKAIAESLTALGVDILDAVMLHHYSDMMVGGGAAVEALVAARDRGLVRNIGVSVYTPEQALACLSDHRIGILQLPFNILDRRWLHEPIQSALRSRPDVIVHGRSAFLQGLLLLPADAWPRWCSTARAICDELDRLVTETGSANRLALCLDWALAQPWLDGIVIGVDSPEQLEMILAVASQRMFKDEFQERIRVLGSMASPTLLDPSRWARQ